MQSPSSPQTGLQLHDIHLPEQVSNLPTAIGWWLLAILFIMTTIWLVKRLKRNKKLTQSKNYALAKLASKITISNAELVALLKWSAMQYFNRQQVANLYGTEFQNFLQNQLPEKHQEAFNQLSTQAFVNLYQAIKTENDSVTCSINNDCKKAVKLWLTYALPPMKQTNTENKGNTKGALAHD